MDDRSVQLADEIVSRALDMLSGACALAVAASLATDRETWTVIFGLLLAVCVVSRAAIVAEPEEPNEREDTYDRRPW